MATLFDELYSNIPTRRCELCLHFESCEANNELTGSWMGLHVCDDYEEEGRTLYDDIFGKEEL